CARKGMYGNYDYW
nr:immunoglobulin heavy chain junction region [Mus musculus]